MKSYNHDSNICGGECLRCNYPDCFSGNPPESDIDAYLQWNLEYYVKSCKPEDYDEKTVVVVKEKGLQELMSADLRRFCDEKRVEPRTKGDIAILERAMKGNYKGKKLEKAIYKVRHRERCVLQKRRNKSKKKRTVKHQL